MNIPQLSIRKEHTEPRKCLYREGAHELWSGCLIYHALLERIIQGLKLGSLTPFSKTKQFYLLIDFLLKVFFLSNLIRIFVALYGTIAL